MRATASSTAHVSHAISLTPAAPPPPPHVPPLQTTSLHTHIDRLQGRIDEVKVQLTKMQHHAKVLVEKAGNRHGVFDRARAEVARRTKAITAVLAQMELEMKAQARLLAELEAAQRTLLRRKLFPGNYLAHD